jgi:uncharacterized protein YxjI
MHSAFQYKNYLLKRQIMALTGKLRFYSPDGRMLMFSQQKMFKLREDIRIYTDESRSEELLYIQARQIIDFSATYDVHDSLSGVRIGAIRRRGWQSMARDEWTILDANEQPTAVLIEDTLQYALLRRLLLGNLLPQNYDILAGETRVADLKQRFNLLRYELDLDFSMDGANRLDRRLGIAAGALLAIVEGKQDN